MFGKTKDILDITEGETAVDGFFGDEAAADHGLQLDQLRDRIEQVEGQINSQFTSMAAYAQIAQEHVELARAESKSETERTESRLTQLIERERADRMSTTGEVPGRAGVSRDVETRLDTLEVTVEAIKEGINDCLSRQKALADAIASLFQPEAAVEPAPAFPPPTVDGPIGGLSLLD